MTKHDTTSSTSDSGSFLSGLGIGLIGGAVGYFLFATEKGAKARKKLFAEWKDVQKTVMPQLEEKVDAAGTLKELATTFFNEMIEQAQQDKKAAEHDAKQKAKKSKKKNV